MAETQINDFLKVLEKSRLLTASQAESARNFLAAKKPETAEEFASELVRQKLLTQWQADQLLKGQTGFVLQQYRLLAPVGRGGMGHVFRATDDRSGDVVAVKVMSKKLTGNQTLVNRFRREIRASSLLNNRHIVRTLDGGRVGKVDFMVMEYVNGDQLDRIVARLDSIPVAMACDIVRQAALGLQHAHERQMVHRDIKPGNLIVDWTRDGQGIVKIMDMGLVRLESDGEEERTVTRAGQVMGTPDYMSPEQGWDTATVDIRSDIYSLGCTLFRLLTGRVPFPGDNPLQVLMARCSRDCPSARTLRPDIPEPVDTILRRMTLRDPAGRFQTPQEVADALEPFSGQLTVEALRKAIKDSGKDDAILLELVSHEDVKDPQDAGYQQFLREMESGAAVDLMISTNGGQGQSMSATMPILPRVDRRAGAARRPTNQASMTAGVIGLAAASATIALVALYVFVNRKTADADRVEPPVNSIVQTTLPTAVLESPPQQSVKPGETVRYSPRFEMPPEKQFSSEQMTFRLGANSPGGVTIDQVTGDLEWNVPIGQAAAAYPIPFEFVFDRDGASKVIASATLVANIEPLSSSFAFPRIEPRVLRVDEDFVFPFTVSPVPEPSMKLQYRLGQDKLPSMLIDADSGRFSWTPSEDDFGRHVVSIELFDPKSSQTLVTGKLPLLVRPEITLPRFPEQTAVAGQPFEMQLMQRPPRLLGKGLMLSPKAGGPEGVTLDLRKGMLKWEVPPDAGGRYEIRLVLESVSPRIELKSQETLIVVNVQPSKVEMPVSTVGEGAIVAAETEVREFLKRDIASAKTPSDRKTLARELWNRSLDQAVSASDAALLNVAIEIAEKARASDLSLELNRLKAQRYVAPEIEGALVIVKNFRAGGTTAAEADSVIEHLLRLSLVAASEKRYEAVATLLGPPESLLKKADRGSFAKLLSSDVETARAMATELANASNFSDAKVQELLRLLTRWQFTSLFDGATAISFVASSEVSEALSDSGRSLWDISNDHLVMTSQNQAGSVGVIDTSRDVGRYLVRLQLSSKTTSGLFIFGASREQNLNSFLLNIDSSEFGRILRVPDSISVQDPIAGGAFSNGWNDLEILVEGTEIRVRLNGAVALNTRVTDLQPGRMGFLVPLERSNRPTLDVRNARILILPNL